MTHVELIPYHGPCSQLDLIANEIIFGRIFEAFQRISQPVAADDKPSKRSHRPPLRQVLVLR
jgi:hypothetical protein